MEKLTRDGRFPSCKKEEEGRRREKKEDGKRGGRRRRRKGERWERKEVRGERRAGEKDDFSLRFPHDGSNFRCQEMRGERRREAEEKKEERKRECGERKLGEQGRAQRREETEERKERDSSRDRKIYVVREGSSGERGKRGERERNHSKNFSMKDLGEATYVLGIRIYKDKSTRLLGLSQSGNRERTWERGKTARERVKEERRG